MFSKDLNSSSITPSSTLLVSFDMSKVKVCFSKEECNEDTGLKLFNLLYHIWSSENYKEEMRSSSRHDMRRSRGDQLHLQTPRTWHLHLHLQQPRRLSLPIRPILISDTLMFSLLMYITLVSISSFFPIKRFCNTLQHLVPTIVIWDCNFSFLLSDFAFSLDVN